MKKMLPFATPEKAPLQGYGAMSTTITTFNTQAHHIYLEGCIKIPHGRLYSLTAILDTGAPRSEFSDLFLISTGLIESKEQSINIAPNLQTQKYGKITLPTLDICGKTLNNMEVFVSHFEQSWGVDALIGLDFFRKFRVTIDYMEGTLQMSNLEVP